MSYDCPECDQSFDRKAKLNTHILLNHPSLARSNASEYDADVSDGYLSETEVEKGKQFGYSKRT